MIVHMFFSLLFLAATCFSIAKCLHGVRDGDIMGAQDRYRHQGISIDRDLAVIPGDDDHVWSSAPTESTFAPTPSGTVDLSAQCLSQCSEFDPVSWNLDNWCKFYWDAGCFLPDVNFLGISPAGKAEVSNYDCVPSCLQDSSCGASYCKTFSHFLMFSLTFSGLNPISVVHIRTS